MDRQTDRRTMDNLRSEKLNGAFSSGELKTLIETHNFLNQSEKHCYVSHSLVFKWHRGFSYRKDSLKDDLLERRPYFRDNKAVKTTFMT
jgi:hypothetical protein